MTPSAGDRLLHYRLVEQIGEGGMGVVWKATDLDLEREVAIKLLPAELAGDTAYLARFEREAKLLATLNHPNIAQIFGLHESDGVRFLAMELVPGTDLARRLDQGPLSIQETIDVGLQVAAALESAHLRGVIHRDLKPANVMRTPGGRILVLDFGLARMMETGAQPADASRSPTASLAATFAGTLLGTAAYMSPEQARGQVADKRSDLWAFGCLLYECLTGRLAFAGETVSDTLAAVLRGEPDWEALPAETPPRLRELLRRCLAKESGRRQRDAGDAALDLQTAFADGPEPSGAAGPPAASRLAPWLAAAAAAVAALAVVALVGAFSENGKPGAPRVVRSTLGMPDGWRPINVRISPDGRFVGVAAESVDGPAIAAEKRIFVRRLAGDDAFTAIVGEADGLWFRFSPDSSQIAFTQKSRGGASGRALVRTPADGSSPPVLVAPLEDGWLDDMLWLSDEMLATVTIEPPRLIRIPLDGSPRPPPLDVRLDSSTELFEVHSLAPDGSILGMVESWSGGYHEDAVRLDPRSGEVEVLVDRASEPTYVAPSWLAFARRDQLLIARYDHRTGAITSAPRLAASGLRMRGSTEFSGSYSISDHGDLVHLEGGVTGLDRGLIWLDRDGSRAPFSTFRGAIVDGSLNDSQDGTVIAFAQLGAAGLFEIWASEVAEPAPRRVLARPGMDCEEPVVSPDGSRLAALCFGDQRRYGLYVADFPTVETEGRLLLGADGDVRLTPRSWTPDGKRLFVHRVIADSGTIGVTDVSDDPAAVATLRPVAGLEGDIGSAMVSPDGRLVGFARWDGAEWSLEVSRWNGQAAGPSRPVLRTGISQFDWTGVIRDGHQELAAVDARGVAKLALIDALGRVVSIEDAHHLSAEGQYQPGVVYLRDGRLLGIESSADERKPAAIRLVTNWSSTLPAPGDGR